MGRRWIDTPDFEDLCEAYRGGGLIVFAGAGVSVAAGLPSWPQLVDLLAARAHRLGRKPDEVKWIVELAAKGQFIQALTEAERVLEPVEFRRAVRRFLDDQGREPPEVMRAIAALAPSLKSVLTTNLDGLLTKAFEGKGWQTVSQPSGDIVRRSKYILHLHGTLSDASSWVLTRDGYTRAMYADPKLSAVFSAMFHAHPLLFVGYGLADDDFNALLAKVRAPGIGPTGDHFALVDEAHLERSISKSRERELSEAGIRIIRYDTARDGKHREVVELLRELAERGHSPAADDAPLSRPPVSTRSVPPVPPGMQVADEPPAPATGEADPTRGRESDPHARVSSGPRESLGAVTRGAAGWHQRSIGQLLVVVFLAGLILSLRSVVSEGGPRDGQGARLLVDTDGTANEVSYVDEQGKEHPLRPVPNASGRLFDHELKGDDASNFLARARSGSIELRLAQKKDGIRYRQTKLAHCTVSDGSAECRVEGLDWRPGQFFCDTPGANQKPEVLYFSNTDTCKISYADTSFAAGLALFTNELVTPKLNTIVPARLAPASITDETLLSESAHGRHVAIFGPYTTDDTLKLEAVCTSRPFDCGPILSLSSGKVVLQNRPRSSLFMLTTDNTRRAEHLMQYLSRPGPRWVIYTDGEYEVDQARELEKALMEGGFKDDYDHWLKVTPGNGKGFASLSVERGRPSRPQELTSSNETNDDEILGTILKQGARADVIFVARDQDIINFAAALERASAHVKLDSLRVFVPGPREALNGVWWDKCQNGLPRGKFLSRIFSLSPRDDFETPEGIQFAKAWHRMFPKEPLSYRAARAYDALKIIDAAARKIYGELREQQTCLDVHLLRSELRKKLEELDYQGASTKYSFMPNGAVIGDDELLPRAKP